MKASTAIRFSAAITLAFMAAVPTGAQSLNVSGFLGQSQSSTGESVSFLGTSGLAQDSKGLLWTGEGTSLYGIDVTGTKPVIARRLGAPNGINPSFGIKCDGAKLYIGAWDGKVYALNLSDTDPKPALFCALPDKWRSAALAPPSLAKGFAAANRLFALAGNAVVGYGADGTSSGTVLTLPPPAQGAPFYNAVGIEPTTGDLLIAGYYPDINVYRYAPDGTQVKEGGWPRGLFAMSLPNIGGIPWALMAGGGAKALPTPLDPATAASVDNDYTYYGSGLVQDAAGTYWYGTSQGLLHFDRKGKSLHQRIGGVHDIRDLALTSDGTVVAFAEGGSRAIRLALDDDTDAPFSSNANEPWRVGGNWTGRAAAAIPDGSAFLVLDDAGKQLWRFDPTQSAKGQSNWAKIGTPAGLGAPKCYAAADTVAWIVDGGRLLEGARGDMSGAHAVPLPGIPDASSLAAIAALDDRTLAVADSKSVRIYMRDPSGSYAAVPWASSPSFVKIVGVAVSGAGLVVSDQDGGSVSLLDPKTGGVLAKVDGSAVDGGLRPGAVAALGNWAVVADEKNSRILRLRIAR